MKQLPTFTLVRKVIDKLDRNVTPTAKKKGKRMGVLTPSGKSSAAMPKLVSSSRIKSDAGPQRADQVRRKSNSTQNLLDVFNKLNPNFKRALATSFEKGGAKTSVTMPISLGSDSVKTITNDLARHKNVRRVGILDMGNWIGDLPKLLDRLNAAQPLFTIFEVQAPLPSGLIKTPLGMVEWAAFHTGWTRKKCKLENFEQQMITNDFVVAAEDIRKSLGLDLIVGMTPAMLAGVSHDDVAFWNHIGSVSGKTILLSTADMRQWAEKAGRPFEAAIGASLVSTLLIAINNKLGYHDDTGCLFDYNGSRTSFVDTLKALQIEDSCLAEMTQEQQDAALAMLSVLRRMKRKSI